MMMGIGMFWAMAAHAALPWIEESRAPSLWTMVASGAGNLTYRVGSEWGKFLVTTEGMERESAAFRRAAMATARVGGATGFLLGEFAGEWVVATNHHVCPSAWSCLGKEIRFPFLDVAASVQTFIGTWPNIDLALFTLKVSSPSDLERLRAVAKNFQWHAEFERAKKLLSIGFGIADNPGRQMVAVQDSDCEVFSDRNEFRLMGDPDALNPADYEAWSFSHGCDVSHGDSGSAMVDRESGDLMGIVWTGKIPKASKVQDSAYLAGLLTHPTEEIWTELNYGVPAQKMAEYLEEQLQKGELPELHRRLLRELLDQPGI